MWGGMASRGRLVIALAGRARSKRPIANRPQINNPPHKITDAGQLSKHCNTGWNLNYSIIYSGVP